MNDDVEKLLSEIAPRGPAAALRAKVLGAVESELAAQQPAGLNPRAAKWARCERRIGWASVIGLLAAIGMNVLVYRVGETRLEPFRPTPPVPRAVAEVTESIESITDSETAEWFRDRLLARRRKPRLTPASHMEQYQRLLEQITAFEKDLCHVRYRGIPRRNAHGQELPFQENREGPEMDRDRSGRPRGDSSYYQRGGRLDHRFTS